jgi:hypothetical protein
MAGSTRFGTDASISRLSATMALLAGLLAGCQPAQTPGPQTGSQPRIDSPATQSPVGAGSFPRSFLIPGTDTSIRIGG